jgi:hypothetical protein
VEAQAGQKGKQLPGVGWGGHYFDCKGCQEA